MEFEIWVFRVSSFGWRAGKLGRYGEKTSAKDLKILLFAEKLVSSVFCLSKFAHVGSVRLLLLWCFCCPFFSLGSRAVWFEIYFATVRDPSWRKNGEHIPRSSWQKNGELIPQWEHLLRSVIFLFLTLMNFLLGERFRTGILIYRILCSMGSEGIAELVMCYGVGSVCILKHAW